MSFIREHLVGRPDLVRAIFERGGVVFDVKGRRGEHRVLCPFHRDSEHPSMDINLERGIYLCRTCTAGGDVVQFHARRTGVSVQDAIKDLSEFLGLKRSDRSNRAPRRVAEKAFKIRDSRGRLIAIHTREDFDDGSKRFCWRRPDGSVGLGGLPTADLPLYGSERVKGWSPDELVILAEGEAATDALISHSFAALGTVTGAKGTPGKSALEALRDRNVVLWPDHDEPGRDHMRRISSEVTPIAKSVRVLDWGEKEKDDAADFFARGGTKAQLRRLLAAASPFPGEDGKVKDPSPSEAESPLTWTAIDLYRATGFKQPEGLLAEHVLCPQSVALIIGPGGTGKTFFALALARSVAEGRSFGHLSTRRADVLFLSEEMTDCELRARLRELFTETELSDLGGRFKVRCRSGTRIDSDDGIEDFRSLIEHEGFPTLVVVDALSDVHLLDENKNSQMGPALKNLRDHVATPSGSCITVIHHAGKPNEFLKGADRGRGASAMRDVAADVLTVDANGDSSRSVRFAKVRHGEEPPPFSFVLVRDEVSGLTTLEIGRGAGPGPSEMRATRQLLDLIRDNGGAMTPVDLKEAAMSKSGPLSWSRATYHRHRKAALESGYMVKDDSVSPSVYRPARID